MIGRSISHYKIIEKLGEGGMGEVYLAHDNKLNRRIALKVLPSAVTLSKIDKTRFLKEAQAAASINHPNVCVIHDIKENDGQQFIIMEYVKGQTLSNKIAGDRLSLEQVIDYATQIVSALHAAHDKKIIHMDIKPDNIMISITNHIKVMDFGVAKFTDAARKSITTSLAGTLSYMSPEQIEGKELIASTDIYSFGVVLYEMLTGYKPFQEEFESALIYSILNEEPKKITDLNYEVPLELEQIVNKSLAKNLSDRYRNTAEILLDFKSLEEKLFKQKFIGSKSKQKHQLIEKSIQSMAVLPLKNYSNDPKQEYFVDGMTDALITKLAKFHSLRIISRVSSMHYKDTDKSISEIAKELSVDAIVVGSILRADKRVRISVQLIHAASDTHVWTDNYDRDFKDILVLQSDVAQAIAREIKIKITPNENRNLKNIRQVNPVSYDTYLRGRFHWYKLSPQNVQKAFDYFSLALEKDPESALAYVGIALVWLVRVYWGTTSSREAIPKAKTLVLKAIEMDDTLEEAHDALARILYYFDWDWNNAEKKFKYAIQLNPNKADAHLFYSSLLRTMGRGDEAMAEAKLGLELDPLSSFAQCYYTGQLLYLHQYDEAIHQLKGMLSHESDSPFVHRYLWICYYKKYLFDDAIEEAINFYKAVGKIEFSNILKSGYSNNDYQGAMRLLAKRLEEEMKTSYVQPVWIARLFAHAGDKDHAIKWIERAYEERDPLMPNLNTSTDWEILHNEERFKKLLRKMNLPH